MGKQLTLIFIGVRFYTNLNKAIFAGWAIFTDAEHLDLMFVQYPPLGYANFRNYELHLLF
ncbi:MAG: hypothetical protein HWQ38_25690 [Nostoc sp. NMS7]|uniref:hypothetical protein n=1 Tax=Nostoc sp. NMS7 TaxID=2815391 RepID=UPI0025DC8E89|nr:hypothetical protein [Nostoc sp. NMS7]MBN3949674.1 hypothetical protein [Nostoc sp. NMS7]